MWCTKGNVMRDKRKKRTEKRFHKNSVFSRRLFLIGVSVSAFLLTGLALLYLFVFSIREIEVVVPGGGEEGCTFVRYEEDLTENWRSVLPQPMVWLPNK